ncbi:hypothetical protein BJF85_09765 [Saccharomonospora sp. CUA-673]|uniref:GNAT family N-acetyltransferase n=1 Tax=Saccharomonospora sp. CUA-673 TaxID=1904969 RepID=UPI0009605462|nr:GNAT family N-acetyltransferase [Saccharomonospora sp. CUA-673]OLT49161.1 hypothetical protein BJF85_09765 [Saccharomonospora sp. CUA-673]
MSVRRATPEDAESLTDLHLDVWDEAYSGLIPAELLAARRARRESMIERWRDVLADGTTTQLVACDDTCRLQGFTSVGPGQDEGLPDLRVMALYVRAEVYGTGVGHALLDAAVGDAPAYLWVLDGNRRAIDFYTGQGFQFDGTTMTEPEGVEHRMVRR